MKSRIYIVLSLLFIGLFIAVNGYTAPNAKGADSGASKASKPKNIMNNVGNEICPVDGGKISPENQVIYRYQGKGYNFCSIRCVGEFVQDPQKYVKKVNEELGAQKKKSKK